MRKISLEAGEGLGYRKSLNLANQTTVGLQSRTLAFLQKVCGVININNLLSTFNVPGGSLILITRFNI